MEQTATKAPASLTIEEASGKLTISRRWFSPIAIVLLFLSSVWLRYLLPAIAIAGVFGMTLLFGFLSLSQGMVLVSLVLLATVLVYLGAGAALTYYSFCRLLNTTRVIADQHALFVKHGPLPWKRPVEVPIRDVEEIYSPMDVGQRHSGRVVNALTRDGGKVELLNNLGSADQGVWIAHRLRSHMDTAEVTEEEPEIPR